MDPAPCKYLKWLIPIIASKYVLWLVGVGAIIHDKDFPNQGWTSADKYLKKHFDMFMLIDTFPVAYLLIISSILCFCIVGCAKNYRIFYFIQILVVTFQIYYAFWPIFTGNEQQASKIFESCPALMSLRYPFYYPCSILSSIFGVHFFRKSVRYHLENLKDDLFYFG